VKGNSGEVFKNKAFCVLLDIILNRTSISVDKVDEGFWARSGPAAANKFRHPR
jgi:hypothetical protein